MRCGCTLRTLTVVKDPGVGKHVKSVLWIRGTGRIE